MKFLQALSLIVPFIQPHVASPTPETEKNLIQQAAALGPQLLGIPEAAPLLGTLFSHQAGQTPAPDAARQLVLHYIQAAADAATASTPAPAAATSPALASVLQGYNTPK